MKTKEHTILNCWCRQEQDEEERSVRAELAKDAKREEYLNGYKMPTDEVLLNKPF